ncbi:MAG: O-antigen translocase, partial [Hyphomicrobiales bacterium]
MANIDPAETGTTSNSYATILRSSAVMGASFAIVMVFSFMRMKFMAVWLGPSGVGLLGVLSTILDLCVAIAGLGVQQSGIRQMAAADSEAARRDVASAIRWLSLGLGAVGAIILAITALPISRLTFGEDHYVSAVALLGLAVLLRILGGGQLALLQGLRQISTLARANILSAFASTAICVPMVYFLKEQAVAPVVVVMAGVTAIITWSLGQRFVPPGGAPWPHIATESRALVHLGLVFMASTLLTTGAVYLARIVILQNAGIVGAGLYQAAWALGVLYSGFILQAMGSDFFPRLSRIANDDAASNRLVNEQIRVS